MISNLLKRIFGHHVGEGEPLASQPRWNDEQAADALKAALASVERRKRGFRFLRQRHRTSSREKLVHFDANRHTLDQLFHRRALNLRFSLCTGLAQRLHAPVGERDRELPDRIAEGRAVSIVPVTAKREVEEFIRGLDGGD